VKRGYLATLGLLLVLGCPGTKKIKELLDDPAKYDGQNVRVAGEVKEAAGGASADTQSTTAPARSRW